MKDISRLAAGSTALLVVLMATACTADSPDSEGGGTLSIGVSADIVELVPSAIQQFNTLSIVSNLYDQLVQEPEEGTVPVPRLAADWQVSDDRLTYTFDLRDDAVFHDGSTVDAEDVLWSIDYAREDPAKAGDLVNVTDVEATDEHTIVVTLSQPQPDFLMSLADPTMSIVPADFGGMTIDEFREHPIGSGPFSFDERTVGTDILFDRFDDYWGDVALVDGLHFKVFPDVNTESLALQSGEIQIASNIALDAVELFQGEVVSTAPQLVEILMVNSGVEILANDDFRRALSVGIDRPEIVDSLMSGFGEPAQSLLSSTAFPDGPPEVSDSPYEYDADAAKDLVASSGYDGTPVSLIYSTGIPTDIAIAQAIQAQLKEVGIEIELRPLESGEWLKAVTAPNPHTDWDLSISRAGSATATPQFGFFAATGYFGGGWDTDDVTGALAAYGASTNAAEEQQALADFEQDIADRLPGITIAYMGVVWVTADGVDGLQPRASQIIPLNTVSLGG
jgi:peptide/nickel transport system substrate-binding protein